MLGSWKNQDEALRQIVHLFSYEIRVHKHIATDNNLKFGIDILTKHRSEHS